MSSFSLYNFRAMRIWSRYFCASGINGHGTTKYFLIVYSRDFLDKSSMKKISKLLNVFPTVLGWMERWQHRGFQNKGR